MDSQFDSDILVTQKSDDDSSSLIIIVILLICCSCVYYMSIAIGGGYYLYKKSDTSCLYNQDCDGSEVCYNNDTKHCTFVDNECVGNCKCVANNPRAPKICQKQFLISFNTEPKDKVITTKKTEDVLLENKFNDLNTSTAKLEYIHIELLLKLNTIIKSLCVNNYIYVSIYDKNNKELFTSKLDNIGTLTADYYLPAFLNIKRTSLNNLLINKDCSFKIFIKTSTNGCILDAKNLLAKFYFEGI